jgi:16S rRNA (adenine1518-N6/adenine1519-N6)-dimethyltransferase
MPRPAPSSEFKPTSRVPATLRALGIRPNKRLGQNFLIDPRVAERIAGLVGAGAGGVAGVGAAAAAGLPEPVVEIGPGLGALTARLAEGGRRVAAVELDLRLAEELEHRLADFPAVRVVRGDILDQEIARLLPGAETVTVVGNLPYSITSPAIGWILEQGPSAPGASAARPAGVRRAILMMQREVAERILAKPGEKEFGSLTVFVGLEAETTLRFRVSPGAFYPRPEVESVVLEITPRPYPGTTREERSEVSRLARAGMSTRRKVVANSLALGLETTPAEARALLTRAGVDPERRGETLSIEEWIAVARNREGAR